MEVKMNKFNHLLVCFAVLITIFFSGNTAFSHSPHDVIFDIALSPVFAEDKTAFLISSNTLMISTDEGYSWKKLATGLDYSSQLRSISISPAFDQDRTLWVTSENNGIYRSENGGKSWKNVNAGLNRFDVVSVIPSPRFAEDHTTVALDGEGGLYDSIDSGRTWTPLDPDFEGKITCMAFLPFEGKKVLLAGTDQGEVRLSDESKHQWEKIALPSDCPAVTSLAISPYFKEDGKAWVGSECGVYEVDLHKKTARSFNQGLTDQHVTSLLAVPGPEDRITLYASSWNEALFETDNMEAVWLKHGSGLTTDPQANDPRFLMPNFKGIASEKEMLFLGGYDGLFKSINGGQTWEQVDTIMLSGITGLDVFAEKGSENHKVALATYGAGAYIFDSQSRDWVVANRGLHWTRLNDMVFSPDYSSDGFLFSGSENNFLLFNSNDKQWQRLRVSESFGSRVKGRVSHYLRKIGLKARWIHSMLPPGPGDTLFPSVIGPSPDFAADRTLFFGTRSSGLYVSTNSGLSNSPIWDANESLITSVCLSPQFAADGTLYAGVYDSGIFRSSDKGKTWDRADTGMPATNQILMSMSPHFPDDRIIVAGNASGLYITQNGGNNWRSIGVNDFGPAPNILCVAISPDLKNDNLIVVGINGKGLWMTQDMGKSFTPFAESLIHNNYQAKFIQFSDNYHLDKTVYCASSYELFCSRDGGTTWHRLSRPIRYENLREEIRFVGDWHMVDDDRYSALSASYANSPGSSFRLRFTGTGVSWIGDKSPRHGKAKVFLDGLPVKTVSLESEKERVGVEILSLKGLEAGSHELTVEILCPSQGAGCGAISIDAIDVFDHDESGQEQRMGM